MGKVMFHAINKSAVMIEVVKTRFNQWTWGGKFVPPYTPDPLPNHRYLGRTPPNDAYEAACVARGAAGGEEIFNHYRPLYEQCRGAVTAWEFTNEPGVGTDDQCRLLAAATIRWTQLMHAIGLRVCVGNFSFGTPQLKAAVPTSRSWEILAPMLVGADYWGRHNYWTPAPYGGGPTDIWTALRHRWDLIELIDLGYEDLPPCIITEGGIDGGSLPGQNKKGWKDFCTEAEYRSQVSTWYLELEKDPGVLAACLFTVGPTIDWNTFEISDDMIRWLGTLANGGATDVVVPPANSHIVIDGRCMTMQSFRKFLGGVAVTRPITRIYLHHTETPTLSQWNGATTIENMRLYYQDVKHWDAGPHLFIAPDGIWLFTPLWQQGIGVTDHNSGSIHLEMVGNYQNNRPSGEVMELTMWALAMLFKRFGLDYRNLLFHRDDEATACPGGAVTKTWVLEQVGKILGYMGGFGLPTDDALSNDPKVLVDKSTWWQEELTRTLQDGWLIRARDISVGESVLLVKARSKM
jgi:hypothetical protein